MPTEIKLDDAQFIINNLCWALLASPRNPQLIEEAFAKLEANPEKELVNRKTLAGYSAIYYAVKMGDLEAVKRLIQLGADLHEFYDGLSLRDLIQQEIIMGGDLEKYKPVTTLLRQQQVSIYLTAATQFRKKFNRLKENAKKFTQYEVRDLISKMNYQHLSTGYCHGIALMGAQAFLLEERDSEGNLVHLNHFARRYNYLRTNSDNNHYQAIDRSDHKRKLLVEYAQIKKLEIESTVQKHLSDQDRMNLELGPFLNGVELFHQTREHNYLFPGVKARQSYFEPMRLVPNVQLEEEYGSAVLVDQFNYKSKEAGLIQLLLQVEQAARDNSYQSPIVFYLSANLHGITIGYDPIKKLWRNINANGPDNMLKNYNAQEMAQLARADLFIANDIKKVNIEINIISTANHANEIAHKIINPVFYTTKNWIFRHQTELALAGLSLLLLGLTTGFFMLSAASTVFSAHASFVFYVAGTLTMMPLSALIGLGIGHAKCIYDDNKAIKTQLRESIDKYEKRRQEKRKLNTPGINARLSSHPPNTGQPVEQEPGIPAALESKKNTQPVPTFTLGKPAHTAKKQRFPKSLPRRPSTKVQGKR